MADEVPPSITVVIGNDGSALSASQPLGPLQVSEPLYIKPATVDEVQVKPVSGDSTPLDHLAAMRAGTTDLVRYRAVVQRMDGRVEYLNASNLDARKAFLGIVLNPAVAGRKTAVCIHGVIANNNWTWQPGPVHCAENGVLTQEVTQNTFKVGQAITSTMLLIGDVGADIQGSGTPDTVVWEAPSASTSWTIVHNMARYPAVTLVDSAHSVMLANITYVNINTVTVDFAYATAGFAYLV